MMINYIFSGPRKCDFILIHFNLLMHLVRDITSNCTDEFFILSLNQKKPFDFMALEYLFKLNLDLKNYVFLKKTKQNKMIIS